MRLRHRFLSAALLALCCVCAVSALSESAPDIVWNGSGAPLNLQIREPWPGMHGAMDPFEAALLREGDAEPGWAAIYLITPAGDYVPALALASGLACFTPGDESRVAVIFNPNPADRLNLRRPPDKNSASRGNTKAAWW